MRQIMNTHTNTCTQFINIYICICMYVYRFIFDNISVHILDMGFGPDCLLTFHKIDDEEDIRKDEIRDRNPNYMNGKGENWTPEMQR